MALTRESSRPNGPELHTLNTGDECYIRPRMTGTQLVAYRSAVREMEKSFDKNADDYDTNRHGMALTAVSAAHYACDESGNLIYDGMTVDELLDELDFRVLDAIWAKAIEISNRGVTLAEAEKKS